MLREQTDKVRKSEKAGLDLYQHTSIQDYKSTRDKGSIKAGTKNVTGQQITRLSLSCLREDSKPITCIFIVSPSESLAAARPQGVVQ